MSVKIRRILVTTAPGEPVIHTYALAEKTVEHHVSYACGRQPGGEPHEWADITAHVERAAAKPDAR